MDGTGTLMMNRFNTKKNSKYEFKKDAAMKRGEYEEIVSADEKICILKWKDNKVNSWMEYRQDCRANKMKTKDILDLLAFRLSVSEYLLAGSPRAAGDNREPEFAEMPSSSRYRPKPLPSVDKQRDGYNHWPVMDTLKEPRVCRAIKCTSRTRCRCSKCDVYLFLTKDRNCFYDFHN
ncbi:unnamed protein product [Parnassius apollo]|uniref:(apollo) hypothetical protein n=1 Tax=Parnassius apollo TaxID=110799 RepID=A0A8S3WM22_PARAO|nr:unnamed protein product [Parnassius apollo]